MKIQIDEDLSIESLIEEYNLSPYRILEDYNEKYRRLAQFVQYGRVSIVLLIISLYGLLHYYIDNTIRNSEVFLIGLAKALVVGVLGLILLLHLINVHTKAACFSGRFKQIKHVYKLAYLKAEFGSYAFLVNKLKSGSFLSRYYYHVKFFGLW